MPQVGLAAKGNWLTGFDENLRPIINPEANYGADGSTGAHVIPSFAGSAPEIA